MVGMGCLNGSNRARGADKITARANCGGPKKGGLPTSVGTRLSIDGTVSNGVTRLLPTTHAYECRQVGSQGYPSDPYGYGFKLFPISHTQSMKTIIGGTAWGNF